MKIIVGIILLSLFISCSKEPNKVIEGTWSIDTLIIDELESVNCLDFKVIEFGESTVELPVSYNYCEGLNYKNSKGRWSIIKDDSLGFLCQLNLQTKCFRGSILSLLLLITGIDC